ncbi:MAG: Gmad2 immunoglobulin-like domain-containing protein [Oscillochloridaceae bacterium]|nr:Gmad2 immunoglobulin-like domain-containing protein [Chloroflexaceae bacterium]MDW8391128.1 Gmad2 immunoglobulin-like domain-containing protein [Oscillochloridaceae bacterium]
MCRLTARPRRELRWRIVALCCVSLLLAGCGTLGRQPTATPALPGGATQQITILTPLSDSTVASPIAVSGTVALQPFERNLNYRLFGPDGALLAQGYFTTTGPENGPGAFSGAVPYTLAQPGMGRLEVVEINAADGTIRAIASVMLRLSAAQAPTPGPGTTTPVASPAPQQEIVIESPPPRTVVGSPVVITGRTARLPAGNSLSYAFRDAAGGLLGSGAFPVSATAEGTSVFNASLTFNLPPSAGDITLEVFEPGAGGAPPVARASLVLVIAPPQAILIDTPPPGTTVGSPVVITGRTARSPFQGALGYRILNAAGNQIGQGAFPVASAPDGPGSFNASLTFALPPAGGRITIEIVDQDASTGQIAASARIDLNVAPQQQAIIIESPPANQQVGSPMTVVGRTVRLPLGSQLTYRVRDARGQQIGAGQFGVAGTQEGGGRFTAQVFFNLPPGGGPITLELLELDPGNGQVRASATLPLVVAGPPPTATPTPLPTRQAITIETPPADTVVGSPVVITGRAALPPQFGELYYVIRTPARENLGQGSFPVRPAPGQTANVPFVASLTFAEPLQGGAIIVEIYDRDGAGQILASANVRLQVRPRATATPTTAPVGQGGNQRITITAPVTDTLVGSPMTIDGQVALTPYQGRLLYRVTHGANRELGAGEFTVPQPRIVGAPIIFSAQLTFTLPPQGGPIVVMIFDRNDITNVILAEASVRLQVAPQPYPRPLPGAP